MCAEDYPLLLCQWTQTEMESRKQWILNVQVSTHTSNIKKIKINAERKGREGAEGGERNMATSFPCD